MTEQIKLSQWPLIVSCSILKAFVLWLPYKMIHILNNTICMIAAALAWHGYIMQFVRLACQLTSQQCFSLTPNQHQPLATSQPAVLFSYNKSAPVTASRIEWVSVVPWNASAQTKRCVRFLAIDHILFPYRYCSLIAFLGDWMSADWK